jgi:hypothetical protein
VRVYAKYFDRGAAFHPDGSSFDDWRLAQGGFRLDSEQGPAAFTVQGDAYGGHAGVRTTLASYTAPFAAHGRTKTPTCPAATCGAPWRRRSRAPART